MSLRINVFYSLFFLVVGFFSCTSYLKKYRVAELDLFSSFEVVRDSSILYNSEFRDDLVIFLDRKLDTILISPVQKKHYSDVVKRYETGVPNCYSFKNDDAYTILDFSDDVTLTNNLKIIDCPAFIKDEALEVITSVLPPLPPSNFQPEVFYFLRLAEGYNFFDSNVGRPIVSKKYIKKN